MVCTGIKMGLNARSDLFSCSPCNDCINNAVFLICHFVCSETQTDKVVYIVRQTCISFHVLASNSAGFRGVFFKDHSLFWCQQCISTHDAARHCCVFNRNEIWVRPGATFCGKFQHLWPKRSKNALWRSAGCWREENASVHDIEIFNHCGIWLVVVTFVRAIDHRGMTDTHSQQETIRECFGNSLPTGLHCLRCTSVDACNSSSQNHFLSCGQQQRC